MSKMGLLFALGMCLVSSAALAAIDCGRAKTNVDKLICASTDLTLAQEMMAYSYRMAMRRGVDIELLRSTQEEWYEHMRNACNDASCLRKAFDERGAQLDNY